jgi:hypothetical protein
MKQKDPNLYPKIQNAIRDGLKVPVFSLYAEQVAFLNPYLGEERYAINKALKLALEFVGLNMTLGGRSEGNISINHTKSMLKF